MSTLVSNRNANGYVSDGANIFYVETNAIKSIPANGGTPVHFDQHTGEQLVEYRRGSYIYWNDIGGGTGAGKIWRMVKP